MINAIIIEDEKQGAELILNLLQFYTPHINVIEISRNIETAYVSILKHNPQVVFLDVKLPDGTGFDLLQKFNQINFKIIFITAYQEYAIRAFQYSAIDYILKPISPDYFHKAVKKITDLIDTTDSTLMKEVLLNHIQNPTKELSKIILKTSERIYSVNINEITRCESNGSYTTIYLCNNKEIVVSRLLKEFDELLSPYHFFRAQQSHLINLSFFDYFEKQKNNIVLKDGSIIPLATRKRDQLLKLIEKIH